MNTINYNQTVKQIKCVCAYYNFYMFGFFLFLKSNLGLNFDLGIKENNMTHILANGQPFWYLCTCIHYIM